MRRGSVSREQAHAYAARMHECATLESAVESKRASFYKIMIHVKLPSPYSVLMACFKVQRDSGTARV